MNQEKTINHQWKQNLVLIAKNTFVWLFQLSQKYNRTITHLDQIPSRELERLKSLGINGLWLIGIWERSPASRKIKELYGNKDSIGSAYSIFDYKISEDLGGKDSFRKFKQKAHLAGLKIGCDMVPNHTGIDSPWIINHPDWFIQAKTNPKPDFKYQSPNLSSDENTEIRIEEGYYTQDGAAEVFMYRKKGENNIFYIYHGNDGTSMPWNDTAQLDYLKQEVRSAVKQTIKSVAGEFDIIRLDAAMTLTKQHFKRLWFPDEGASKFIPTRENDNLNENEFNLRMPHEFWAEVLETVNKHEPGILLIAEAFWLMEGFFIRNLGMHSVYNSAFMNFLRTEENRNFKNCIRDMIAFDRLSLDHLVNYQTTPDEEPAINQFGKGDKYFGICTLLATMPGLPMFGHGQLEGFKERYGMDFLSPQLNETPDENLISRHRKEITPLLNNRSYFSQSTNFILLDFLCTEKDINENVIAFFNQNNGIKTLVAYNNSKNSLIGSIQIPVELNREKEIIIRDYFTEDIIQNKTNSNVIQLELGPYKSRVLTLYF